jgi:hypothetical protein
VVTMSNAALIAETATAAMAAVAVGMIAMVLAHLTTDAVSGMAVATAVVLEIVITIAVREATWNPSAAVTVGIVTAIATETMTAPETTTAGNAATTTVVTMSNANNAGIKAAGLMTSKDDWMLQMVYSLRQYSPLIPPVRG